MNSKLPPSLPPLTLPGNSSKTTKVMIPQPFLNYPHKCAPVFLLTNKCGQRVTYNGNPILEQKAGINIVTTWVKIFQITLSRLGMNPN